MKSSMVFLVVSTLILVGLASYRPATSAVPDEPVARTKWDYKTLAEAELTKVGGLEKLGDEGWELASVVPRIPRATSANVNLPFIKSGGGGGTVNAFAHAYEPAETKYIFKRPK